MLAPIKAETDGWTEVKPLEYLFTKGLFLGLFSSIMLSELIDLTNTVPEFDFKFYKNLHIFLIVLVFHELLHVLIFPNPWKAKLKIVPKKMIVYVTTNDIFTRNRLLISLVAPLFILSFIPLVSLCFYQHKLPAYIAICNLVGSGSDILNFFYLQKTPKATIFKFLNDDLYKKNL